MSYESEMKYYSFYWRELLIGEYISGVFFFFFDIMCFFFVFSNGLIDREHERDKVADTVGVFGFGI